MSREIKFRAWVATVQRMVPLMGISENVLYPYPENGEHPFPHGIPAKAAALMQYTGLKDRNGKEIYEGDLPGDQYESGCVQWCDTCHGWSIGIAMIEGHCHQCDGDFMWLDFVDDVRQGKVEIVGNRFENPELIPA